MKNIAVFIYCIVLLIDTNAQSPENAAQRKISINATGKPLSVVLLEIERKGNVVFSYSSTLINSDSLVTIRFANQELGNVLSALFKSGISYRINQNDVILYPVRIKVKEESLHGKEKLKSEPAIIRDTIVVFKMDTIIQVKRDTLVVKVFDTVISPKIVYKPAIPEQRKRPVFFLGLDYQMERNKTNYDHFGYDQSDAELLAQISAYESPIYSFRAILIAGITFKSTVVSIGLGMHNVRDKFYHYGAAVDFSPLDTNSSNKYSTNSLKYLNIPVNIGWFKSLGRKFQVRTEAGLGLNILSSSTGNFVNISKSEIVFSTLDRTYLNKIIVEVSAGLFAEYKITRNLTIHAGPSLFKAFSSEYTRKYPVTKRRYSVGLFAGLHFNILE
ncbi:MAG TPA: STN domain-containing protein [Ignavibacteria bacterium]|nr:STN domain-containing protein [Ignavibacteria bacterium]